MLGLQLEKGKFKQEMERKLAERDEELELARKGHQKQLDALQQSLDSETSSKGNLGRQKRAAEEQLAEIEMSLSEKEKEIQDLKNTTKKLQSQIKVNSAM